MAGFDKYLAKENPQIKIIHNDNGDWEGLYIDNKLIWDGDELTPERVLEALGIDFSLEYVIMKIGSTLPDHYSDVKFLERS